MQCRHTHQLISATWQSNKYRNFPHQTWNTNFFLGLYVTVNYKIASGCKAKNRHIIHWFKNSPPKLNIKLTVCEKWKVAPLVNLCIHLLILIFDLFYLENWYSCLLPSCVLSCLSRSLWRPYRLSASHHYQAHDSPANLLISLFLFSQPRFCGCQWGRELANKHLHACLQSFPGLGSGDRIGQSKK